MRGAFSKNRMQSNGSATVGAASGCPCAPWAAPRGGSEQPRASPTLSSSIDETGGPQPVALLAEGVRQHTTLAPPRSRYRICQRDGDKQSVS